jgi:hypothetical protein
MRGNGPSRHEFGDGFAGTPVPCRVGVNRIPRNLAVSPTLREGIRQIEEAEVMPRGGRLQHGKTPLAVLFLMTVEPGKRGDQHLEAMAARQIREHIEVLRNGVLLDFRKRVALILDRRVEVNSNQPKQCTLQQDSWRPAELLMLTRKLRKDPARVEPDVVHAVGEKTRSGA